MTRLASLLLVAACGPMYPQSATQAPGDPSANEPGQASGDPYAQNGQQDPFGQNGQPNGDGRANGRPVANGGPGANAPGYNGPSGGYEDAPRGDPGRDRAPADPYDAPPPAPAPRPAPPPPPAPAPRPPATAGKVPSGMPAQFTAAHNVRRGKHCAQPLTWSPQLASVAQGWANTLVKKGCKFEHSGGQYGENLAAGSTGSLNPEGVVAMWYDEIKSFDFRGGGFSMQTGHFTQVVWRGTSQVGCGVASCNGMDLYVCNYDAPGNVEGEYRQNVVSARDCR